MDLVSSRRENVLSSVGRASGKYLTEGSETHYEAVQFEDRFGLVGVLDGENPSCDCKSQNARSIQQAARSQSGQRFAVELLLFVGGDEPLSALRQAQACRFSR